MERDLCSSSLTLVLLPSSLLMQGHSLDTAMVCLPGRNIPPASSVTSLKYSSFHKSCLTWKPAVMRKHAEEAGLCCLLCWNRIPAPHVCTYPQGSNYKAEEEAQNCYLKKLFHSLKPTWVSFNIGIWNTNTHTQKDMDKAVRWTLKEVWAVVFPQTGLCAAE